MYITKPEYYDRFACLAGACPDTCCGAWQVEIDEASLAFYRTLDGPLGQRVRAAMAGQDGVYHFTMTHGCCDLLTPEGLCAIQQALGERALCRSCGFYPRYVTEIGARRELGLCLSCPEAARLILTAEGPFALCTEQTDEPIREIHELPPELILALRTLRARALDIAADRSLPFGQRCARILALCAPPGRARRGRPLTDAVAEGLAHSCGLIHPADDADAGRVIAALRSAFAGMEYLESRHRDRLLAALASPTAGGWTQYCPELPQLWENLLCYGICRYFPRAAFDRSIWPTAVFCVVLPLLLRQLLACAGLCGSDAALNTAWILSRELEHSELNMGLAFRYFRRSAFRPDGLPSVLAAFDE